MFLFASVPWWIKVVSGYLKTKEMCNEAVCREPYTLDYVPDHLRTQEMCNKVMSNNPGAFFLIPDSFKTQKMCVEGVQVDPWQLKDVPDHFKTKGMCDNAVWGDPFSLQYVPDWFVTQQQVKLRHDDDYYCDNYEIIWWYNSYEKSKAQKAKIKEELLPITWHSSRWHDWCFPETEKLWK